MFRMIPDSFRQLPLWDNYFLFISNSVERLFCDFYYRDLFFQKLFSFCYWLRIQDDISLEVT